MGGAGDTTAKQKEMMGGGLADDAVSREPVSPLLPWLKNKAEKIQASPNRPATKPRDFRALTSIPCCKRRHVARDTGRKPVIKVNFLSLIGIGLSLAGMRLPLSQLRLPLSGMSAPMVGR
jgi:hypothetical protein